MNGCWQMMKVPTKLQSPSKVLGHLSSVQSTPWSHPSSPHSIPPYNIVPSCEVSIYNNEMGVSLRGTVICISYYSKWTDRLRITIVLEGAVPTTFVGDCIGGERSNSFQAKQEPSCKYEGCRGNLTLPYSIPFNIFWEFIKCSIRYCRKASIGSEVV